MSIETFEKEKNKIIGSYLYNISNPEYQEKIAEAAVALKEIAGFEPGIENPLMNLSLLEDIKIKRILQGQAEGTFRAIPDIENNDSIKSLEITLKATDNKENQTKTLRHELVHLLSQNIYDEQENGLSVGRRYIDEIFTEMYAKKIGIYLGDDEIKIGHKKSKEDNFKYNTVKGGYDTIEGYAFILDTLIGDEIFDEKFAHVSRLENLNPYLYTLDGLLKDTFENPSKDNFKKLSKQIMTIATEFVDNYDVERKGKRNLYNKYMDFRDEVRTYGTPQFIERDLARIDKEFAKKILDRDSFSIEEEGKILKVLNQEDGGYEKFILDSKLSLSEVINIKIGTKTYVTENIKESKSYDKKIKNISSFEEVLSLPATSLNEIKKNKEDYPYYMSATALIKQGLSTDETLLEIKKALEHENDELNWNIASLYGEKDILCDKDGRNILYPLARMNLNDIDFYYKVYDSFIENDFIVVDKILEHVEQLDNNGFDCFDYALQSDNVSFLAETINQMSYWGVDLNEYLNKHIDSIYKKPNVFFDTVMMLSEHRPQALEEMFECIKNAPDNEKFPLSSIKNNKEQDISVYVEQTGYRIHSHGKDFASLNNKFESIESAVDYLYQREKSLKNHFADNGMYSSDKDKTNTTSWEYFLTLRDFTENNTKQMLYDYLVTFNSPYDSFNDVSYDKIKNNPEMFGVLAEIMGPNVNYLRVDINDVKVPLMSAVLLDKEEQSLEVAKQLMPYLDSYQKEVISDNAGIVINQLGNKEMFKLLLENDVNVFKDDTTTGLSPFDKYLESLSNIEILKLTLMKTSSGKSLENLMDENIKNPEKRDFLKKAINDITYGTFLDKK